MKIVRVGDVGHERPGVVLDDGWVAYLPSTMGDVDAAFWNRQAVAEISDLLAAGSLTDIAPRGTRFAAPIAKPEKIVCIGLNYSDHALESGQPVPKEPIIFMKSPGTIVGPNDEILVPRGSLKTDWEVELGVVIGRRARYLATPEEATAYVAGYCVSHDVSEREWQLERGSQWDRGKSCETFNPLGPWLVTPDEVPDPQNLTMGLSVNGVLRQNGSTADMIFGVNYLLWYLSQYMVLEPGDLINTGTPAGVSLGHDDVAYLRAGDEVSLRISGLGQQRSLLGQA
jgi:2-keto-4-pentenoate hydratase/2-oxohepta-3-ene-1,7-dioic acid hydratase in catechol pathway